MEEFICNFQDFNDWLIAYKKVITNESNGISVYIDILNKFKEFNLDKAF